MGRSRAGVAFAFVFLAASLAPAGDLSPEVDAHVLAGRWQEVRQALTASAQKGDCEASLFWSGVAALQLGDHRGAVALLERALFLEPRSRGTGTALAWCAVLAQTPAYAGRALEAFPVDDEVHRLRGRAELARHFYLKSLAGGPLGKRFGDPAVPLRRAIAAFRKAELLGPDRRENATWLAVALYQANRYAEALPHAEQAAGDPEAGWEVHAVLGHCRMRTGDPGGGEAAFARALGLAPDRAASLLFERGKARFAGSFYRDAIADFKAVLKRKFGYRNARHWLGRAAFGAGDLMLALWAFRESREVDQRIDDLYWCGRCAFSLEEFAWAETLFTTAIEAAKAKKLRPPAAWTHYLGRAEWEQGKRKPALDHLQEAFRREPKRVLFARGLFGAQLAADDPHGALATSRAFGTVGGQLEAGVAGVETVLKRWPMPRAKDFKARKLPHVFLAHVYLGDMYFQNARYRQAVRHYTLARATTGMAVSTPAAWSLALAGLPDQAERAFRTYLRFRAKTDQDKDRARIGLAYVLLLQGKKAEAAKTAAAVTWVHFKAAAAAIAAFAGKGPRDGYTALGVVDGSRRGKGRGLHVRAVIPRSPAARAGLLSGDILLQVGSARLGKTEQTEALRKTGPPTGIVEILVRRGEHRFALQVEFSSEKEPE